MSTAIQSKTYKLENILDLSHYMKIVIDDAVVLDDKGNYLINVGYLRVSTERQAELGYGLDLQEAAVVNYCTNCGIKNLVLFIDDGYTGTTMNRPALNGLIAMIQDYNNNLSNIRINTMIVPRIDRLGRTLLGTLQFIQDYIVCKKDSKNSIVNNNKEDINFISVAESHVKIDQNDPQSKLSMMIFATLAEYDRDMIVKKLKDGRTARVASGKWMGGGNVPYGYRYDKDLSQLLVIPEEAEKIREIFRLYIEEKMAPQRIADRLGFKGDRIITQILKRKSLTGCIIYNGKEYQGEHEAIISLERWQEAQDELEKRSVHRAESNYLLSGLLVCGECGAKMRYQKWNKSGDCKIVCYSKQKSKPNLVKSDNCQSELFWASDIEEAVIAELFRMSYLGNEEQHKTMQFYDPLTALKTELKEIKEKQAKWNEIIGNGGKDPKGRQVVDLDDLYDQMADAMERRRAIEYQLDCEDEKKRIARKIEKTKNIFRSLNNAWQHMTDKEKQTVCRELIDRIVIHKEGIVDVHLKLRSYLAGK